VGRQQLGFGWGKGRRVIKTTIAGDALARALAKQQRWVDLHWRTPADPKPASKKAKLRMAKARARREIPR
jgi:hypothetical protein